MSAKVSYSNINNKHCIKLRGDVRYADVIRLQSYVEQLNEAQQSFVIDVTEATHLDSTALGSLALIAKLASQQKLPKPDIFVTNPQVYEALLGVCFDRVFNIQQERLDTSNCQFESISSEEEEIEQLTGAVHTAHQALADLSESNRELFKDVNDLLSRKS